MLTLVWVWVTENSYACFFASIRVGIMIDKKGGMGSANALSVSVKAYMSDFRATVSARPRRFWRTDSRIGAYILFKYVLSF